MARRIAITARLLAIVTLLASTAAIAVVATEAVLVHGNVPVHDNASAGAEAGNGGSSPDAAVPAQQPLPSTADSAAEPAPDPKSALLMTIIEVSRGDTLTDMLIDAGSSAADAAKAIDALDDIHDLRRLQIGQVVTIGFHAGGEEPGELAEVRIALADNRHVVASRISLAAFLAERVDGPLDDASMTPVTAMPDDDPASGLVTRELEVRPGDTLMRLAVRAGAARQQADLAIRALVRLVDPTALQVGQTLQVTFSGTGADTILAALSLDQGNGRHAVAERVDAGTFSARRSDRPFTQSADRHPAGHAGIAEAMDALRAGGARVAHRTIAGGDTLMDLIVDAGATITEALGATRALARHYDPQRLQIGQHLYIMQTPGPAGSDLQVPGLVVLHAGRDEIIMAVRTPEGAGFEGELARDAGDVMRAAGLLGHEPGTHDAAEPSEDTAGDIAEDAATDFGTSLRVERPEVRPDDTLMSILLREGAGRGEADRAIRALEPHHDPRELQVGHDMRIAFDRAADGEESLVAVSLRIGDDLYAQATLQGENFVGERTSAPVNPAFSHREEESLPPVAATPGPATRATTRMRGIVVALTVPPGDRASAGEAPDITGPGAAPELSVRAEKVAFRLAGNESVAESLKGLDVAESSIDSVIKALAGIPDDIPPQDGRELVVIIDRNDEGAWIAALSLDAARGGKTALTLQRDGSHAVRDALHHVDLPHFDTASSQAGDGAPSEQEAGLARTSIEIRAGGTLMHGLLGLEIDAVQADQAVDALRDVFDPRRIRGGQVVEVLLRDGELHGFTLSPRPGELIEVSRDSGAYVSVRTELPLERQLHVAVGTIRSSLYQAAVDAGVPLPVLADMIRAYSFDVDFQREIRKDDRFELLYERFVDEDGNMVRHGPPLYMSLHVSGVTLPVYRFVPDSDFADYFNDKGESVRKALLRTPVDGARITSEFGMRTLFGYTRMHKGLDFGVPTGTPVVAAGDGVIEYAGRNGSYGNYVRIRHNSTYKTAYAHLNGFAKGIARGTRVRQGQTIGYVGSTGRSTGPHLHYEVLVHDEQINPLDIRLPSGEILTGAQLERFHAERDALDALFERTMTALSAS